MNLQKDLREFIESLSLHDVRFVIVGAFAVAHHGYPRYTSDIDIFVDNSPENAQKLERVVRQFGFEDLEIAAEDFIREDQLTNSGLRPIELIL